MVINLFPWDIVAAAAFCGLPRLVLCENIIVLLLLSRCRLVSGHTFAMRDTICGLCLPSFQPAPAVECMCLSIPLIHPFNRSSLWPFVE